MKDLLWLSMSLCGMALGVAGAQTPVVIAAPVSPEGASTALGAQVMAILADPGVVRAHWGIAVTAMDGTPLWGLEEGKMFRPASNAKLFTTAAAMALLGPDDTFATQVVVRGSLDKGILRGDLVLRGGGDANFAGGYSLPYVAPSLRPKDAATTAPLQAIDDMAAKVAAMGVKVIEGDVVGDDREFEQPAYPEGWSVDDMLWGYGAPVSALTVHDNQIDLAMSPSSARRGPATITLTPDLPYYRINSNAMESDYAPSLLTQDFKPVQRLDRAPGSLDLLVYGNVNPGQATVHEEIAIDEPAKYAAIALRAALEQHGVQVRGTVRAQHEVNGQMLPFLEETHQPLVEIQHLPPDLLDKYFSPGHRHCIAQRTYIAGKPAENVLLERQSPPLAQDVVLTLKTSQNLHAEVMLRNISVAKDCPSSLVESVRRVRQWLIHAGLNGDDFVFYDGSGLSAKDLVTPRATAQLLAYASAQPWFAPWKAALPVGGVDGSLASRFTDAPLKGHVFAKTGTLGESRALSGYVDAASGRTLIFSILVDNHAPGSSADRVAMDKIVAAIAAAN